MKVLYYCSHQLNKLNKFIKMIKSKSFSSYGSYLDRKNALKGNPQSFSKAISRGKQKPIQVTKKDAKFIEGFNRVTDRQKLNSFQIHHTRDCYNQTNYQVKEKLVHVRSTLYPVRRQSEPRLKKLIVSTEKYQPAEVACNKYHPQTRDQNIMTTRDLQKTRRSFHNIDFCKQNSLSHSYIKNPQGRETTSFGETQKMMRTTGGFLVSTKDALNKQKSVHSFGSYPKRQFLSQKKLSICAGSPYSGIQAFKIPQQKFKGSWKIVSPVKFNTVPDKNLSRYDRDCESWHPKLTYQPKQQLVIKKTPILDLSKQTGRQLNEVQSKYPIRLAI